MEHVEAIQQSIQHRMLLFRPESGHIRSMYGGPKEFFQYCEQDRAGPAQLMEGETALGWEWPCGSVYMESEHDRDPAVAALEKTYADVEVVASLAGAPHTLTIEQASEMYRSVGWTQCEPFTVGAGTEESSDVVLLYRPTIVLHDLQHPDRPIAVGTAELRIEAVGAEALITSARMLGFAVHESHKTPKAAGWFLAHVLGMHLGDISRHSTYAPRRIRHMVMLSSPAPKTPGKAAPDVCKTVLDRFDMQFIGRAMCHDEIDLCTDLDEDDEEDAGLAGMALHYVSTAVDFSVLSIKAGPDVTAAVRAFAEADKRPGLKAILGPAEANHREFDKRGIEETIRAAASMTITIGTAERDFEFPSMRVNGVNLAAPGIKPVRAEVLVYSPYRDRHPFDTWDNSSYGVLDTLELICKGATYGEGFASYSLKSLGYSNIPAECLILQPPERRLSKNEAKRVLAALMLAAQRCAKAPDTVLIIELPYDPDPDGDGTRLGSYAGLYCALDELGFRRSSDWVFAYPAALWEMFRAHSETPLPTN